MGQSQSRLQKLPTSTNKLLDAEDQESWNILCNQVFSNPVVTDCICKHLRTAEIRKCSLVSKTWNITARSYLRKRRWLYFKIRLTGIPELKQTVEYLQDGNLTSNHPFRGLSFRVNIDRRYASNPFQSARSKSLAKDLLERLMTLLPLKHVAILFHKRSMIAFISDILFPLFRDNQIETLSCWSKYCYQPEDLFKNLEIIEWSSLESVLLSKFRITDIGIGSESCEALLRTCPNLQKLTMFVGSKEISVFDKYNKIHVIKSLEVCTEDFPESSLDDIISSEKASLFRLENLLFWVDPDVDWWTQFKIIHGVLKSSYNSLQRLQLNIVFPDHLSIPESIFQINLPQLPFAKEVSAYSSDFGSYAYTGISYNPHLLHVFPNINKIHLRRISMLKYGFEHMVLEATSFVSKKENN